jgi:hypothetical protein
MTKLTFNCLLKVAGVDPKHVALVRHQISTQHSVKKYAAYHLLREKHPKFELYQKIQRRDSPKKKTFERKYWASFVATPQGNSMFAGLYVNRGTIDFPADVRKCPVTGNDVNESTHCFYNLEYDDKLDDYSEKLFVEWKARGARAWVQKADIQDKAIVELLAEIRVDTFPGYKSFRHEQLSDIESIPDSWQEKLRSSKGIYLLWCNKTGRQYVGKADGQDGFWGRFLKYARTVDGGNEGMKKHNATKGYTVTILEAIAAPMQDEIDALEKLWKEKLGTYSDWGLNENK